MPQPGLRFNSYSALDCFFVYHCVPNLKGVAETLSQQTLIGDFRTGLLQMEVSAISWNAMNRFKIALAAVLLSAAGASAEGERPVVVELYTSQGCSSCPPADAMFEDLAERDDIIALALHVDYWDYIGWKDTFGDPVHAERQRAYAAVAGRRSIYTPEFIVDGQTDVVGAKPMKLMKAIETHRSENSPVALTIERDGNRLAVRAQVTDDGAQPMSVQMVRYAPSRTAEIKRGENAGKTITYRNVVEEWADLGVWNGRAPFEVDVALEGDNPVVVLIQSDGAGPILAAAEIR
jgi:hypothetical protein